MSGASNGVDYSAADSSNRAVADNDQNKSAADESRTEPAGSEGEAAEASRDDAFDAVAAAAEFEEALRDAENAPATAASAEEYARMLESEIESMSSLLAQKEIVAQRAVERADSAVDEIEESKQRLEQEMAREVERRSRDLLRAFLDVLDDLDRAIASAREMDHNPDVLAGVELVRKGFLAKLSGFGVEHLAAQGETFDPNVHEAVSTTAVESSDQDGKVAAVVREGYKVGEDVLRPAMVVVGKHEK